MLSLYIMLTKTTLKLARRQMSSYGELETGALEHLTAKIVGHPESGPTAFSNGKRNGSVADGSIKGKVRVWDENKGAFQIKDI